MIRKRKHELSDITIGVVAFFLLIGIIPGTALVKIGMYGIIIWVLCWASFMSYAKQNPFLSRMLYDWM